MATEDIVTDPFLRSMLDASTHTLQQCIILLELADINALPATSSSFQNTLLVISKQQKLLQSHLGQLRGYNRNALLTARDAKQITAEARQEIDRLHLQLQNLYYEQRHLRGEITACESYE